MTQMLPPLRREAQCPRIQPGAVHPVGATVRCQALTGRTAARRGLLWARACRSVETRRGRQSRSPAVLLLSARQTPRGPAGRLSHRLPRSDRRSINMPALPKPWKTPERSQLAGGGEGRTAPSARSARAQGRGPGARGPAGGSGHAGPGPRGVGFGQRRRAGAGPVSWHHVRCGVRGPRGQ